MRSILFQLKLLGQFYLVSSVIILKFFYNMIVMLLLSIVLISIILIFLFSMCFCVRRPVEHYQLCAKLPSMPRGYLADFKLSFRHATLKPKG